MRVIGLFSLVVGLTLYAMAMAAAASAAEFPPGAEAREAQVVTKLSPKARAWIKREAAREAAANTVSKAAASQAIQAAGSGLDLANMPIEDAIIYMMMLIARDAEADMRQMLADMQKTRARKEAMRQQEEAMRQQAEKLKEKLKAAETSAKNQRAAVQGPPKIARTPALDDYLNSRQVSYESLADMSEKQQLRLQMLLDRRTKAMQTISSLL